MTKELVKDWMTRDVVTTEPSTPLALARNLMKQHKVHRLPVLDEEKLVGIITFREVHELDPAEMNTLSIWDLHELLSKLYVKGEMTADPITVSQNDRVGHAAKLMLDNRISGLPVVDDAGQLIGIITESDIFRVVIKEWGE